MALSFYAYAVSSILVASLMVGNVWYTKLQFYPTMIHLVSSKSCAMVMGNLGLLLTVIFGRTVKSIFLGYLRPSEIELLIDRMKVTIFDTLLIMTIFRDDFSTQFIVLFTILLFSKTFHWLAQDRVDYFDQSPMISTLNYIRIAVLLLLLVVSDIFASYQAITEVLHEGPSMMLLFASEFVLLLALSLNTVTKFGLHLWDLRHDGAWENKGVVLMYMEFGFDIFRLIVHIVFSLAMRQYYGLSLHVLRQIYLTLRSFKKRITEIIQYRRATANMDQRFPDATPEELARTDAICIVCREEMTTGKKLPCGHILHYMCLRSWLERAQQCPTCRRSVFVEQQQNAAPAAAQPMNPPVNAQQGRQPMMPPDANQLLAGFPPEQFVPFQPHFFGGAGFLPPHPVQIPVPPAPTSNDPTQQMLLESHSEICRQLQEVNNQIYSLSTQSAVLQEQLQVIEHMILSLQTVTDMMADRPPTATTSASPSEIPTQQSSSTSSSSSQPPVRTSPSTGPASPPVSSSSSSLSTSTSLSSNSNIPSSTTSSPAPSKTSPTSPTPSTPTPSTSSSDSPSTAEEIRQRRMRFFEERKEGGLEGQ